MEDTPHPHILLIDDDPDLSALVQVVLRNDGYRVSTAATAEDGYAIAVREIPNLILCDVMLPGMDGYALVRRLRQNAGTRALPIVMLTARGDIADKIAGFEAGADDYITKPFQPAELTYRIKSILARAAITPRTEKTKARSRMIVFFSGKGGVGKTTLAVNLAVALKRQTSASVLLFDADLFCGDVGVHLNLVSKHTLLDLTERSEELDEMLVNQVIAVHSSGIHVLQSPARPEQAELITAQQMRRVLDFVRTLYDFVIVDCQTSYDERELILLEQADEILLVLEPEIGAIRNSGLFFNLMDKLGIHKEKIRVILNRADSNVGINMQAVEAALQHQIAYALVTGGRAVSLSVNHGVPLVIEQPAHPLARQIVQIADLVAKRAAENGYAPSTPVPAKTGLSARLGKALKV